MRRIEKLIRATETRRTRFHTERGSLMQLTGWLDLPRAVVLRLRRRPPLQPWMVPGAVRFLAKRIGSDWCVLELGAGLSTVWFATRASHVTSLEDDLKWHIEVSNTLERQHLTNCRVEHTNLEEFIGRIRGFPNEAFDLVLVDSNETATVTRVDCARASIPKLKRAGLLVFDDFDKHAYRPADALFQGWPRWQFTGIKGFPMTAVETAIFSRPPPPRI